MTDPRAPQIDVLVIGAGPAGSAAAAILAERGRRVRLLEKDRFPRPKVCGEFLSATARPSLERLGVLERVEAAAETIRRGSVHLPGADPVAFELPRPALGLSRFLLDDLLASRARELGADLRFAARVLAVDREPNHLRAFAFSFFLVTGTFTVGSFVGPVLSSINGWSEMHLAAIG